MEPKEPLPTNEFSPQKGFILSHIVGILLVIVALLGIVTYRSLRDIRQDISFLIQPAPTKEAPVMIGPATQDSLSACEYVDVISEEVSQPDIGDNIQKNIGYQNNKVGLYIYSEVRDYVGIADELANSNGGDWGYVLIPYNVKDYNTDRWSHLFELLGEKKLIPIIQLWDLDLEKNKREEQIEESAEFLNNLRWPIKNRYISVYNEPNDAKFWKGDVDPEGYAKILEDTINEFKDLDKDFFMMNAAFNASARTGGDYLDMREYLRRMNKKVPGIFTKLDGWASHPYPQPNFSGSPTGQGRDSVKAYEWELNFLKSEFGVENLPVFITETGWAHKESEAHENGERVQYGLTQYQVADNIRAAFEKVWLPDERVVAVTPFTIRYEEPHDHFSWITKDGNPYPQFDAVKDIKKVKGKPPVINYKVEKTLECKDIER